eukprot:CCRYP_000816-RA/>CCRYP_000816-RA protein AED:0.31 eAED:0.31 QI:592/1/1/1/0/0/2/495/105
MINLLRSSHIDHKRRTSNIDSPNALSDFWLFPTFPDLKKRKGIALAFPDFDGTIGIAAAIVVGLIVAFVGMAVGLEVGLIVGFVGMAVGLKAGLIIVFDGMAVGL